MFTSDGSKISVSQNEWKASTDPTTTTTTKPKATEAPKATIRVETPLAEVPKQDTTEVYYKNCTAVREAGADPIYEGDPGYSTKLDRDGDGVACE